MHEAIPFAGFHYCGFLGSSLEFFIHETFARRRIPSLIHFVDGVKGKKTRLRSFDIQPKAFLTKQKFTDCALRQKKCVYFVWVLIDKIWILRSKIFQPKVLKSQNFYISQ